MATKTTRRKKPQLPEKPSALIRLALTDLEAAEKAPNTIIDHAGARQDAGEGRSMSGKLYEPVAFRGNPARLRGLVSDIKLQTRQLETRDGDLLEIVLRDYVEMLRGVRTEPSLSRK